MFKILVRSGQVFQRLLRCLSAVFVAMSFMFTPSSSAFAANNCVLNSAHGQIQHVIEIQFDNTHFTRDNPNVPSDLEQMPHLLNFIENNGVLLSNHHTSLISHTATDILTTLTGVYGDRHGVPVSNSFRYFLPNGNSNTGVSFAYWTDPLFDPSVPVSPTDTKYNMLTTDGHNAPAPWVPFTRAGCDFGAVATANIVLENNNFDIPKVFGNPSQEYSEFLANPNLAFTDFVGLAVHCSQGSAMCASGRPDLLPDEPGGYSGYSALFGAKNVNPQIGGTGTGNLTINDLNGQPIINPTSNTPGFPGFDGMEAPVTLSFVAALQEHGVPVTFAYISDAHDNHPSGPAFGPGEAGYVAALKSYDDAFDKFFTRLANDGINSSNTLFVFTADEGDHFVGGTPSNSCDGVNTACTYSHVNCPSSTILVCPTNNVGELNANMAGLLATEQGITTPFRVHSDDAPTVYITGNPARDAAVTRTFERATGQLTATNFYKGITENLTLGMADPVEMDILHIVTADPARTSTFTWFARPDYFLFAGAANCNSPCVQEQFGFAWNHGDIGTDITTTWLGMVGPGVQQVGVDSTTWSDHTDVRPTILSLVGLNDDYSHDGRVLFEEFEGWAVPSALRNGRGLAQQLAQVYKQINAPVGQLGLATIQVSTRALESNAVGDSTYTDLENQLSSINSQRDSLASQMIALLEGTEFNNQPIDKNQAKTLIKQGQALLGQVNNLAAAP
jgi:hypothetical protein